MSNIKESGIKDSKREKFIRELKKIIQAFLSRLRIYYPDQVDSFLEKNQCPEDFQLQVKSNEPTEKIGDIIGLKGWYFLRDHVLLNSSSVTHVIEWFNNAADCNNATEWFEFLVRKAIETIKK